MTFGEWIAAARAELERAGNPDAQVDARLLVCGLCDLAPGRLAGICGQEMPAALHAELERRLDRRLSGEPLQYIEGAAYFMGLKFAVDSRVLIPRQDTETLCEQALTFLRGYTGAEVLDLCTGSGAIAISVARLQPGLRVAATDMSSDALSVASENAHLNGVYVRFMQGDLFEPVAGERFDAILCNPPYLTADDMVHLQTEVACEPRMALFGGEDGLMFYRRLAHEVYRHLKPGGYALFEVGDGQAAEVLRLMSENAMCAASGTVKDLPGVERVVWIRSR
ncbi:MAG: peptide chain release factor N(5)-glutamine methyltransferase [Clostridiales bacterium]|nr:peptide chain release factor N(5)-glutamine methyltransferase [Clostridiales bacterium]